MNQPKKANQLQQFLCATDWIRNALPAYSQKIAPLPNLMEKVYKEVVKSTKKVVRTISIDDEWVVEYNKARGVTDGSW